MAATLVSDDDDHAATIPHEPALFLDMERMPFFFLHRSMQRTQLPESVHRFMQFAFGYYGLPNQLRLRPLLQHGYQDMIHSIGHFWSNVIMGRGGAMHATACSRPVFPSGFSTFSGILQRELGKAVERTSKELLTNYDLKLHALPHLFDLLDLMNDTVDDDDVDVDDVWGHMPWHMGLDVFVDEVERVYVIHVLGMMQIVYLERSRMAICITHGMSQCRSDRPLLFAFDLASDSMTVMPTPDASITITVRADGAKAVIRHAAQSRRKKDPSRPLFDVVVAQCSSDGRRASEFRKECDRAPLFYDRSILSTDTSQVEVEHIKRFGVTRTIVTRRYLDNDGAKKSLSCSTSSAMICFGQGSSSLSEVRYRGTVNETRQDGKLTSRQVFKDQELVFDVVGASAGRDDETAVLLDKLNGKERAQDLVGWKLVQNARGEPRIAKLSIFKDARVVVPVDEEFAMTRKKMRADRALVVDLQLPDRAKEVSVAETEDEAFSIVYAPPTVASSTTVAASASASHIPPHALSYRLGHMVFPDAFDDNVHTTCSNGIHFFEDRDAIFETYLSNVA